DERVQRRREIFDYYKVALEGLEGLTFQPETKEGYANRWLSCIQINGSKREHHGPEQIRLALEKVNIESRRLWKPMHLQPVFRGSLCYGGAVSEGLFDHGLCLPSGTNMNEDDIDRVAGAVRSIWETGG